MAQFDDIIGDVMKQLDTLGVADNTIVVVSTDNGAEGFSWPDGGTTPFKGWNGMGTEGGFRVPFIRRWPGKSFPPSALGLCDMAGNFWEWTSDRFRPHTYRLRVAKMPAGGCCSNPRGPDTTADPCNPYAADSRVQKGGSFMCHASYCESDRPSAKMASPPDTGMSHLGFRCAMTPRAKE